MKIEEFVSIHRTQGHTIKKVRNYYFRSQRDTGFPFPVYSAFPLDKRVKVTRGLVRTLKWKFLITQVIIDLPKKDIYEYMLNTDNYELEQFKSKLRKKIKKSLRIFSFRKPSLEDLLNEGYAINKQTCERQSRKDDKMLNYSKWSGHVNAILDNPGYTIMGAYLEDLMVGYLGVYELEGRFHTDGAFIDRNHTAGSSPMKGLLYSMVNDLINKHGSITLSYGFHRYLRTTPLTSFKETMLFRRHAYAKGYVVNPVLLLALRLSVFAYMKFPKCKIFRKKIAREIISLYQGHRRLQEALQLI